MEEEFNSKPKRRVVRRIIRRVPSKAKMESHSHIEEVETKQNNFKQRNDFGILAEEEPVSLSHTEKHYESHEIEDELIDPKEMILRQLSHGKPKSSISGNHNEIHENHIQEEVEDYDEQTEKRYFSWIPWVIVPLIVIGIVVFALSYFAGAEVTVTPKMQEVTISSDITTEKDVDASKLTPLSVLLIEDKVTSEATASESKTTIATALGKVTIFNKQKVTQTLIKTTRLEAADGKIYRIRENIKIPAANGNKPGTFDVMVYAESAGPDYNKKAGTDFNIPGFKGKPQFDLVYAKSITDITGGSSGVKKSVSKETMEELAKTMRIELENKLRTRATREVLSTQVSYESLYQFSYKEPELESSDAPEKAKVSLSGTLAIPVFDRQTLSRELAKASVKDYAGEDIRLNKIEQISAKISGDQKTDLMTDKKVTFHFEGNGKFVWGVDVEAFTKALLNVSKNDVSRVAARFTGIDKVTAVVNPFWKNYFPGNTKDIKIKLIEVGD